MKRLKNFNFKSVLILGSVLGGVSAIYFGVPSMNSVTYVSDYQDVLATETVPPEEPIEEIKDLLSELNKDGKAYKDYKEALKYCVEQKGVTVVSGSLYLISDVRVEMLND